MSTILSCIGRTELNWNTVIQLQSTYQFHPEACDKLCLSLVSDSGEIKIPPLQQGEGCSAAGCAGGGRAARRLSAQAGGEQGKVPWHPTAQEHGQPHGVKLGCSQIKGCCCLCQRLFTNARRAPEGKGQSGHRGQPCRLSALSWREPPELGCPGGQLRVEVA